MNSRRFTWMAGLGCVTLMLILCLALGGIVVWTNGVGDAFRASEQEPPLAVEATAQASDAVPVLVPVPAEEAEDTAGGGTLEGAPVPAGVEGRLAYLYQEVNRGVVNIRVYTARAGMAGAGAGSGFILDEDGHIVTNNHVVAGADLVTVIFHDGTEVRAEIVGTDGDSDLAVVKVDGDAWATASAGGARPLLLGDSSALSPGDWVVAIGNPFSLGSSMTLGIVSAIGRTIPSVETPFSIPMAIQTDAAINPGNSGGPLLALDGRVVGVNAQIESTTGTNSGVGFAIPSDVVRLVVPALIENGRYAWPWLGVTGTDVGLLVQQANDLPSQEGAYLFEVVENSPAAEAGLPGSSGEERVHGQVVPRGGDVVLAVNGEPIQDFTALLTAVAFKQPGDVIGLTILRDGEYQTTAVELAERPANLGR